MTLAEAAAKRIGTPFHWGGRADGVGLDCWGLLVVSLADLRIEIEDPCQYSPGEYDRLIELLSKVATRCDQSQAHVGVLRAPAFGILAHCGIVDGTSLIHASSSPTIYRVVREPIEGAIQRVASDWFRLS